MLLFSVLCFPFCLFLFFSRVGISDGFCFVVFSVYPASSKVLSQTNPDFLGRSEPFSSLDFGNCLAFGDINTSETLAINEPLEPLVLKKSPMTWM